MHCSPSWKILVLFICLCDFWAVVIEKSTDYWSKESQCRFHNWIVFFSCPLINCTSLKITCSSRANSYILTLIQLYMVLIVFISSHLNNILQYVHIDNRREHRFSHFGYVNFIVFVTLVLETQSTIHNVHSNSWACMLASWVSLYRCKNYYGIMHLMVCSELLTFSNWMF